MFFLFFYLERQWSGQETDFTEYSVKALKRLEKIKAADPGTATAVCYCYVLLKYPVTLKYLIYVVSNFRGSVKKTYSQLSLSRLRLSRITAYLEEKIWSLF